MKKRLFTILFALCAAVCLLTVTALALEDSEPNDTISQAQKITMGQTIDGSIAIAGDIDFCSFELKKSGQITLDMTSYMEYYNIILYDKSGDELWAAKGNYWDSAAGLRHDVFSIDLNAGTYYIQVSGKYGSTGTYVLETAFTDAKATETEDNNSIAASDIFSLGSTVSGQIALNDPHDFYKIVLPESGCLSFDVTSYMEYYSIILYDESGDELWADEDNYWDNGAGLRYDSFTIDLNAGTYYIKLSSEYGYTGIYRFFLNRPDPFTDVPEDSFYYAPVLWAVENGITKGMTDTTFVPDGACTRGQVVTFLWRAAGCPGADSTSHPFVDVKEGAYYYQAMLWALENGITNGVTPTTFEPDKPCDRGTVVTLLWRAKGKPAFTAAEHPFTDVDSDRFYYNAMLWAVENGIAKGMTATTFVPDGGCTRGQVVTFLCRAYAE